MHCESLKKKNRKTVQLHKSKASSCLHGHLVSVHDLLVNIGLLLTFCLWVMLEQISERTMCILNLYDCFFSCGAVKKCKNFVPHARSKCMFFILKKTQNRIVLSQAINQNQISFGQDTVWKLQPEKWKQKMKDKIGSKITVMGTAVQLLQSSVQRKVF